MRTSKQMTLIPMDDRKDYGHKQLLELFHTLYEQYHGSPPTWKPKHFRLLDALRKVQSDEVIAKRMVVMFTNPPKWPPGKDFDTFYQHIDKFVYDTSSSIGGSSWRGYANELKKQGE